MRIEIRTVSPGRMRYSTCGDWVWLPDGTLLIEAAENGRDDSSCLVALHQLAEALVCRVKVDETDAAHQLALDVEQRVCEAIGGIWGEHEGWLVATVDEVDRQAASAAVPAIERHGARLWAELHLYGLRGGRWSLDWWQGWVDALPFDGCPCEEHFRSYCQQWPPERAIDFFAWGVELHNAVNARIGRPEISVEDARELWTRRGY